MIFLNRLYSWYGKKTVLISLAVIIALVVAGVLFSIFSSKAPKEQNAEEKIAPVEVGRVGDLTSDSQFRVTGTVQALSEARLQTESSGRITAVNVSLGDIVAAGSIIASLENSAQRASLLQAEGAYDAAVAGAATSESTEDSAETALRSALSSAVTTYKSSFITADSAVRSTIDDLFTDPTGTIPGFRIEAYGSAPVLNAERTALESVLDTWSADVETVTTQNVAARLTAAHKDVERISAFTETLAGLVDRQDTSSSFTQEEKSAAQTEFLAARTSLNQTLSALQAAVTSIENANEALARAKIAGSGTTVSLSDAQLKSALGTLRAAQASYEKTLVRTPIRGVINALYLKAGDYANTGAPAAIVANNNALEISTALSEQDANAVSINDEVTIDGAVKGIVTAIAPAIDPLSAKKEVKISVSDDTELTNGSIVTVEFKRAQNDTTADGTLFVPLSALKVTASGSFAFSVAEDNTLSAHNVTLGTIKGDVVEIQEGLSPNDMIVVDARGLKEGQKVEVTQK